MGWRNYKEGARNHYVTLGVVVFSRAHGRTSHAIIWVIEVWIERIAAHAPYSIHSIM